MARKILVLGDHGKPGHADPNRAMNIACAVVICVVVLAMIAATIVYFVVNRKDAGLVPTHYVRPGTPTPTSLISKSALRATPAPTGPAPTNPSAIDQFGAVQSADFRGAPSGVTFPTLSAADSAELAKSHQLEAVKNYASGQKNAILNDMKYSMTGPEPTLFKGATYFPYRGKEDELMYQAQTREAKKYADQFNQSDALTRLREKNIRLEL
jgi:hypothetical protein